MNREIKFRYYNHMAGKMELTENLVTKQVGFLLENHHTQDDKRFSPLMQFTGLKDKNGKEIYEGDVVMVNKETMKVIFDNGCFYTPYHDSKYRLGGWQTESIEVIGNIYENPELFDAIKTEL